jgi:hypothetical protein
LFLLKKFAYKKGACLLANSKVLLGLKKFCGILHLFELAFFFGKLFAQSCDLFFLLRNLLQDDFDRRFLDPGLALCAGFSGSAALLPACLVFLLSRHMFLLLSRFLFLNLFHFAQDHEPYGYEPNLVFQSCKRSDYDQEVFLIQRLDCLSRALLNISKHLSCGGDDDCLDTVFV